MAPFPFFCQHDFFLQLFPGGSFSLLPLFFFGDVAQYSLESKQLSLFIIPGRCGHYTVADTAVGSMQHGFIIFYISFGAYLLLDNRFVVFIVLSRTLRQQFRDNWFGGLSVSTPNSWRPAWFISTMLQLVSVTKMQSLEFSKICRYLDSETFNLSMVCSRFSAIALNWLPNSPMSSEV